MRMSRRLGIFSSSKGGFSLPIYTGDYEIYGDETKGYISLLTSGILTLSKGVYDIFAVGGGGSGTNSFGSTAASGGGGGGSGFTNTIKNVNIIGGSYSVQIGSGGAKPGSYSTYGNMGGVTQLNLDDILFEAKGGMGGGKYREDYSGSVTYLSGGYGGSGGGGGHPGNTSSSRTGKNGGSDGSNGVNAYNASSNNAYGGIGQGTTTRAFGETLNTLYAGGGGGGGLMRSSGDYGGKGGNGGGGDGATYGSNAKPGTQNTGSGGGGAGAEYSSGDIFGSINSASGGSGIAMVRWGDWSEMVA